MIPIIVLSYFNQFNFKSIVLLYILTIISALYKPLMEWRFGGTLGKMANKIKVVNEDLKPINIDQGFGRYIPWGISVIIQLMAGTHLFMSPSFKNMETYAELMESSQTNPLNSISTIYSFIFILLVVG